LFRAGDPTAPPGIRFVPGHDRTYLIDGPGVCHDALMDEPHVGALAAALTDVLARAGGVDDSGSAVADERVEWTHGDRNRFGGDGERGGVPDPDVESA
jgi:hypothetical protein